MRRTLVITALLALFVGATACSAPAASNPAGSTNTTGTAAPTEPRVVKNIGKLGKTVLFMHTVKVYDPTQFPKTSMNGEPSDIPFFKPEKDEGVLNRDYPAYDNKTFKFLALPAGTLPPQSYYMFDKNGGTLNPALASSGYKATEIVDQGHIKILPNLYVGYYDFAWVPLNVIAEYWSGNESMSQELWRDGNDYVIVANSYNGGISLLATPTITDVKQVANTTVGIMNPSYNIETLFEKKLESVGLSTSAVGGNVNIEMGNPGLVMNDLLSAKLSSVFAWGSYAPQLQQKFGYKEVVPWTEMGYGKQVPYVVLVVRRDILAKHPDIVQKVVQLNYDATKLALTVGDYKDPLNTKYNEFKVKYMGQATPASTPALIEVEAQAGPVFLKAVVDYMTRAGYFVKPYTFNQLVDESFYNKVKK